MSIEKCFAVYFPLKSKTKTKWATGIVGIILTGYDSVNFFVCRSLIINSSYHCLTVGISWENLRAVDSALYAFGPFTIMFITNVTIVFKFMRAKCQNNSTESTDQALAKSATRGTAMVVTVCVAFLLLTAPTGVHNTLGALTVHPVYRAFMNLTQYLNHSISGVLYCIVGSGFREELFKVICRKQKLENVNYFAAPITKKNILPLYQQTTQHWTILFSFGLLYFWFWFLLCVSYTRFYWIY